MTLAKLLLSLALGSVMSCSSADGDDPIAFVERQTLPQAEFAVVQPSFGGEGLRLFWPAEGVYSELQCPSRIQSIFSLSPDGRWLASLGYSFTPEGQWVDKHTALGNGLTFRALFLTDIITGKSDAIYMPQTFAETAGCATWSPNGDTVYYAYYPERMQTFKIGQPYEPPVTKIMTFGLKDRQTTLVTEILGYFPASMAVDPTGRRLAIRAHQEIRSWLFWIDLKTKRVEQVKTRWSVPMFSWRPDGNAILFEHGVKTSELMLLTLDDGMLETLIKANTSVEPHCSPTGTQAILSMDYNAYLYRFADKHPIKITWLSNHPGVGGSLGHSRWSQNGRFFATNVLYGGAVGSVAVLERHILLADWDKREVMKLGFREHDEPIHIIENRETLEALRKADWVVKSKKRIER
jgi:hypothetical protein